MIPVKKLKKNPCGGVLLISFLILNFISCGEIKEEKPRAGNEEVKPPEQIIDVAEAQQMFKNYSERRVPLIEHYEDSINVYVKKSTDTFSVARYTSYDYATIKQYLAFIEQEAQKANVEVSSLRFYFSNYPDDQRFANGDPIKHPRQNSIFIMPTMKKEGNEFGFYTAETEQGQVVPVLLTYDLKKYEPNGIGVAKEGDAKSYAGFSTPGNASPTAFSTSQSLILNRSTGAPPPWQ